MFEIQHFFDEAGCDLYADWYFSLKDRMVRKAIDRRLSRVVHGNFGDCKPCQEGVWELRIDLGPGWRLYYALAGKTVVLLLCGGSKRTQQADIAKACACWKQWQKASKMKDIDNENTFT